MNLFTLSTRRFLLLFFFLPLQIVTALPATIHYTHFNHLKEDLESLKFSESLNLAEIQAGKLKINERNATFPLVISKNGMPENYIPDLYTGTVSFHSSSIGSYARPNSFNKRSYLFPLPIDEENYLFQHHSFSLEYKKFEKKILGQINNSTSLLKITSQHIESHAQSDYFCLKSIESCKGKIFLFNKTYGIANKIFILLSFKNEYQRSLFSQDHLSVNTFPLKLGQKEIAEITKKYQIQGLDVYITTYGGKEEDYQNIISSFTDENQKNLAAHQLKDLMDQMNRQAVRTEESDRSILRYRFNSFL